MRPPSRRRAPITWYAFRVSDTTYGIFDTFEDEDGRQAHLNGAIPKAPAGVAPDMLAADPDIRAVEVVASNSPAPPVEAPRGNHGGARSPLGLASPVDLRSGDGRGDPRDGEGPGNT